MNRLLLVSNRLPVTLSTGPDGIQVEPSGGGLATGLRGPHERSGGLWIGWPGPVEITSETIRADLEKRFSELGIVPVYLRAGEVRRYYEGFANGLLWPLFHYLTGHLPLRVQGWPDYQEANQRFADAAVDQYRDGDLIWVHDYQLMLVPALIRKQLPEARIAFFLHTPFPSSELFAALPMSHELLEGVLGADLIGFHTPGYTRHFGSALARLLGVVIENNCVYHDGRRIRIGAFPMGVDATALAASAAQPEVVEQATRLRDDSPGKLLVGIDRLDYTKGIPRRLLAFEHLLAQRPEWHGQVRLLQLAVPSRTRMRSYRKYREEVDALVGRINGSFGTPQWMPVHYLYRSVPEAELLSLYRAADALLVTPVRDGMNLVAKEFAAARVDDDGVLILSRFAGASGELRAALMVNPYDIEGMADAMHHALTLRREQRRQRMQALRAQVLRNDVHKWVETILDTLTSLQQTRVGLPNALAAARALASRATEKRPILFLDYDGTLSPIVAHPDDAVLSAEMKATVSRLAELMPVVIVSGRTLEDLHERIDIPGLIYAGDHGFDIDGPNGLRHEVGSDYVPGLQSAALELSQRLQHIDGALVEEKRFSVAVHFRMVRPNDVPQVHAAVRDVLGAHAELVQKHGNKVVELRPALAWDKGRAVLWILAALNASPETTLPIYLGDDTTDEDALHVLSENGVGILVATTPRPTRARYWLRSVQEVQSFLEQLSRQVAVTLES